MQIITVRNKLTTTQLKTITEGLNNGGLVIYPTETCYGIGALCTSERGVNKLIRYKRRPKGKAISVAVTDRKMAEEYVDINSTADNLYKNFLPGPITVVSKSKHIANKLLESETGTLGIRISNHVIPRQIIKSIGKGITATSANVSGGKVPYQINDVLNNISNKRTQMLDIIIDYGKLPKRPPTIVIDTTLETPTILRGEDKLGILTDNKKLLGRWESSSEDDTNKIAETVWNKINQERKSRGITIFLSGELGAGKTYFVKGLARALEIQDNIISPTFMIERQYNLDKQKFSKLYHYDLWRIEQPVIENTPIKKLLQAIGIEDATKSSNLVAIEWPEKIRGLEQWLQKRNYGLYIITINHVSETERSFKLYKINE